jgi:hypothetical protein
MTGVTSLMVAGGCAWAEAGPVKGSESADDVIRNGTHVRTQPPAHVPLFHMESGEIGSRRAGCGRYSIHVIVDRPLQ